MISISVSVGATRILLADFQSISVVPNLFFLLSLAELYSTVAFVIDACTCLITFTHVHFFDRTIANQLHQ